ncbi:MAG: SUMF1/EgtB/PvdO family nonheme iron enzyme [Ignavibacteriales bacterium]|jgi:Uncharacterized conserved protein|nr:MAG: SUMF1/EgtB/PvdO family nonheme iron enzyme [Ignavibacteriaceae bacterium]MBW7872833.1 SUMF1/EgtB/PvdO family nonheme iron enzyme [Ignavibacteria bacterium]MCZ2143553.1 SUMF1/EgtB/PvdO family nonheme iron enzyme [Ignavibacteriales bacterium]OQY75782.1 MAG: hypothetical protein B6D45_05190 [Ignavibacteriales bacterium UTCHB3]MBV6444428.1 hypothetical protein [Ignavibacteriaceae bacterium]
MKTKLYKYTVKFPLLIVVSVFIAGFAGVEVPVKQSARTQPEMIFVQGGSFIMGCTSEQGKDCDYEEKPAHQVTVSDFYIGKYEVTQELWHFRL